MGWLFLPPFLLASLICLTFTLNIMCTRVGVIIQIFQPRDLLLQLQVPPPSYISARQRVIDSNTILRASRKGPHLALLGWYSGASGGRDGSAGHTRWALPGGRGGQGGKPQSAACVVPQSKRDKRLPALGGLHLCYRQTEEGG